MSPKDIAVARLRFLSPASLGRSAAALFLLLITPFAVFLQFQGSGLGRPEVLVCVMALAAIALVLGVGAAISPAFGIVTMAGLLTLFADVQFGPPSTPAAFGLTWVGLSLMLWMIRQHAVRIVTLAMATVLVSSVLLTRPPAAASTQPGAPVARRDLPLIVHLIVDEHIGIEGLPADLTPPTFKRELQSFYERHRFRLFGRAYSEYFHSLRSISHLLNVTPGAYDATLFRPGTSDTTWELTRNVYFNRLAERGYTIQVYQPNYLDTCADRTSAPTCHTYRATSPGALDRLPAPTIEKSWVVASMYLDRSAAYKATKQAYQRLRRRAASKVRLPRWNWDRNRVSALTTTPVVDMIAADLAQARRGDFVFAHLLMPHYPYIYDSNCRPHAPSDWLDRIDRDDAPRGMSNSEEGRAKRYVRYFEQVGCVQQKLDQLLAAIPAALRHDAVVIIQGDHGSRITLRDPRIPSESRLVASDFTASYSTLFAVRSPYLETGYDLRTASITCILKALLESDFTSVARVDACSATPTVFLSDKGRPVARPLPRFGFGPQMMDRTSNGEQEPATDNVGTRN